MSRSPLLMRQIKRAAAALFVLLLVSVSILRPYPDAPKTPPPPSPPTPDAAEFLIPEDQQETVKMLQHLESRRPRLLKAAICLLVQPVRLQMLRNSLDLLHRNFNWRYGYPVLIFHEKDFLPLRSELRRNQSNPLFFQMVHFQLPDFFVRRFGTPASKICPWSNSIGYKHMCRFHFKTFYEQPAMRGLQYYWRLDDDSALTGQITADPFRLLRDSGAVYGYRQTVMDSPLCTFGLWNLTRRFIAERGLSPTFFNRMPENFMFFNNFEVSSLRFWRSPEYRSFAEVIDQDGGVYKYRWGDAPIKTLALSVFVSPERIASFADVGYQHGDPQVPPRLRLPMLEQLIVSAGASNSQQ